MWRWRKRRIGRKRGSSVTKHYVEHKKEARTLVLARLEYFNEHYQLKWNRVAIRNQRRCWGSCSSLKNLNFNYKIILLPPHLADYIIVHELCHLVHLHHKQTFWDLVGETIPDYKKCVAELRTIDKLGHSVGTLTKVQAHYQAGTIKPVTPMSGEATIDQPDSESCVCSEVCNCRFGKDYS
jgi:hypothetical protein